VDISKAGQYTVADWCWLWYTFATLAIQNGVDAKTVSSLLGHYSAGFTLDTYTHTTSAMQKAAADKVGSFIAQTV